MVHIDLRKRVINIFGMIVMISSLAFICKRFTNFGIDYYLFASPRILALTLGLSVVQLLSLFLLAYVWRVILKCFVKSSIDMANVADVYFKSNIAKYLPGNVGHYIGRQVLGISLGMTQTQLALSSVFEIGLTTLSALMIALIFGGRKLFETYDSLRQNDALTIIVGMIACILSVFVILLLLKVIKKNNLLHAILSLFTEKLFWISIAWAISLYIIQFFIFGSIFVLLVRMNILLSVADILILLTASIISWIIGFITPGVPGGMGIRESALLLMLPKYPQDTILFAAIIHRVIMIFGDIMAWIISVAFLGRNSKKTSSDN